NDYFVHFSIPNKVDFLSYALREFSFFAPLSMENICVDSYSLNKFFGFISCSPEADGIPDDSLFKLEKGDVYPSKEYFHTVLKDAMKFRVRDQTLLLQNFGN